MAAIWDAQGFKGENNKFIIKEVAFISLNQDIKDGLIQLMFKPPYKWSELPGKCRAINLWLIRNHHGLLWEDGEISYDKIYNIHDCMLMHTNTVYVKGEEKKQWLRSLTNREIEIINLEEFDCPSLRRESHLNCKYHEIARLAFHCAVENVKKLKYWFQEEMEQQPSLQRSLRIYFQLNGKIEDMNAEDIAKFSKEFLLKFASTKINNIWEKLPTVLQQDADIIGLQRCLKHYNSTTGDAFDGPTPFSINCSLCSNENIN